MAKKKHYHKQFEDQCVSCQTTALVPVKAGRKQEIGTNSTKPASVARAARYKAFLAYYGDSGSFGASCEAIKASPTTVRRWLEFDPIFASKYEDAKVTFVGRLESAAHDRAINGVVKTVASAGKWIADDKVYPDALTMFLLRANDRGKYADGRRGISAELGTDDKGNKYFKVYEGFDPDAV
jgi:hypothetical protein